MKSIISRHIETNTDFTCVTCKEVGQRRPNGVSRALFHPEIASEDLESHLVYRVAAYIIPLVQESLTWSLGAIL